MKKLTLLFGAITIFVASCQENKQSTVTSGSEQTENKEVVEAPPAPVVSDATCYFQQNTNDTVSLRLNVSGSEATGTLNYQLKEKDRNTGTLKGKIENDVLIADYTFNAEGTSSVREVAFQIKDGKATEGYGDMEEKAGKMVFKDRANIAFGRGIVLTKTECK